MGEDYFINVLQQPGTTKGPQSRLPMVQLIRDRDQIKYVVTVKSTLVDSFLEARGLVRQDNKIYDRKGTQLGLVKASLSNRKVRGLRTPSVKKGGASDMFRIILIQDLTKKGKSSTFNRVVLKPENKPMKASKNNMIRRFKDFPEEVKHRMTVAHRISLMRRLLKESFDKVAKSCLPEDEVYLKEFKNAGNKKLEAELTRLQLLYKA